MSFKVGDKVVCVDFNGFENIIPLSDKKIYTVRYSGKNLHGFSTPQTLLVEVINDSDFGIERGYATFRFRKVDESFAEGVLENILKNTSVEELEEIEEEYLIKK